MIRTATMTDSGQIAALMTQLGYPTSETEMTARLSAILPDPGYQTYVAERQGRVVGMAGLRLIHLYDKSGLHGQLLALCVDRDLRGQGIGEALVLSGEGWLKEQGAVEIIVNSSHFRTEAHRFYQGLGYENTGIRLVKSLTGVAVQHAIQAEQ